jgi:hypothetical protein
MLESVCEKSSEHWAGSLSDASQQSVQVPPDVLARYVGVYTGIYGGNKRTYEVSLSGDKLIAKIVGNVEGGLGAAGLDEGAPRPLVPLSQTVFEGLGLGYRFIVEDDKSMATALIVIHISGPYRYARER